MHLSMYQQKIKYHTEKKIGFAQKSMKTKLNDILILVLILIQTNKPQFILKQHC